MNPFDELLKFHEATRKEIYELEANVEKCNIDHMLLKYDSDKIVQDLRFTEAFLRDSYRDEDGKELLRNAEFKADIVADANIYVSGFRKDREKFTSLYNQDPETVLQYHQKGLRYVIRLLEYHANLRLHRRYITPEVEEQHFTFIRLLLLSGFLSDKELELPIKEHSYGYWTAVRDTMGW
ncbi:uncharacterized protein ASPGLDRAFT_28981 [Aspergillus glaucus CBS 516.65]|uniref:Uncharacterized protein n=1 Tax=Aspergillus glaucus CBS 516.65 TaxID=1160497 RepID=A0A1L9V9L5_ASPGL|nr:hypothetical protein ASPGLDRAFT_28981 [Aspergillus glaucus CBS 516.65]OJJ80621.1 hypothetical protein ASPGLDRAFT_28981 [Aspergillus glaucus CBS 516.65]